MLAYSLGLPKRRVELTAIIQAANKAQLEQFIARELEITQAMLPNTLFRSVLLDRATTELQRLNDPAPDIDSINLEFKNI